MDSLDTSMIAGIALNQINEMEGVNIEPDRKSEAEHWAHRGIDHLRQTYDGLDPNFYAQEKAERAVLRYVKVSLRGQKQPPTDKQFVLLADQWAERAQMIKHQEESGPNEDTGRFDMFAT